MSVKIRLSRVGKKKQPVYRIVAIDSQQKPTGKFLEIVGFYDPKTNPPLVRLKMERINYWLNRGAQPSETVKSLLP